MAMLKIGKWNTGNPKVKGAIWNTEYGGHSIEVQWLRVCGNFRPRRRYRLYVDDKCVSKELSWYDGKEPNYEFNCCSNKVLHGYIRDENDELHIVRCCVYLPRWETSPSKSIIGRLFSMFRVQVEISVDDEELIYDSLYESEEEFQRNDRELERIEKIELQRDEAARRAGKLPVIMLGGKKKYRKASKVEAKIIGKNNTRQNL